MKRFKEWEKAFTCEELRVERARWKSQPIVGWPFGVDKWTQAEVQHAVYFADDVVDWQRFRVSLKGLPTGEKISRLGQYLLRNTTNVENVSNRDIIKCRVDNYIGALVRGGQLDRDLIVVR